jgi:hypothetical protein
MDAADNKWIREARERGHRDHQAGVPYSHCPYVVFFPEGRAWQNGWLAEKEGAKKK